MKLQKTFKKKMTKIDINVKNLSSSPKKEPFRATSPIKVFFPLSRLESITVISIKAVLDLR
jgi:hypothetical protein